MKQTAFKIFFLNPQNLQWMQNYILILLITSLSDIRISYILYYYLLGSYTSKLNSNPQTLDTEEISSINAPF
jgi:hypothetical protein